MPATTEVAETAPTAFRKIFSEWFWSEASAAKAAAVWKGHGYATRVRFAMAADGYGVWLAEAGELVAVSQ